MMDIGGDVQGRGWRWGSVTYITRSEDKIAWEV